MDDKLIKEKCDINRIEERTFKNIIGEDFKVDYIIDDEGNAIIPVSPLEFKMIEKIKDLEKRIEELESAKTEEKK